MSTPTYSFKNRKKIPYETVLLSRCPVACNRCTVTYYKNKGRTMEYCLCRCHSHSTPSSTAQSDLIEPEVGIGKLF